MIEINSLEKRWLRYKIKSYLLHLIIFFALIIVLLISFMILSRVAHTKKVIPIVETQKEIVTVVKKEIIIEKVPIKEEKTAVVLKPSLNFIGKIEESIYTQEKTQVKKEEPIIVKEKKTVPQKVTPPKREKSIHIVKQQTISDIQDVIKRFEKNHNPALSLFIAKKYYERGQYKKSYNYALLTNEINNNIEASWLIFAKSLVKLKENNMAITMLTRYIRHSKSYKAEILLDDIRSGNFR